MISVIVPVYNIEKSLYVCIESIVNQTYKNFELILIDDGSFDNSGTIIDTYAHFDSRVLLIHQKNKGVSNARNVGLSIASGDYICFIDSDDYIDKDYLHLLFEVVREPFDLSICGFDWIRNNEIVNRTLLGAEGKQIVNKCDVMDFLNLVSSPWVKLFRADIIRDGSISFPEDISYGEDLLFNFEYIDKIDKICVLNKPSYHYVTDNQQSLLRRYNPELLANSCRINSAIHHYLVKWGAKENQIQLLINKEYYDYENVMRNTFSIDNPLGLREKLRYNNNILKSKAFQTILKKTNVKINTIYYFAYKVRSYLIIQLYSTMVSKVKKEG